jgi:hypothetical protein
MMVMQSYPLNEQPFEYGRRDKGDQSFGQQNMVGHYVFMIFILVDKWNVKKQ